MSTLLQLNRVKDPALQLEDGQSTAGRVQTLMTDLENDIRKCGNLLDPYH